MRIFALVILKLAGWRIVGEIPGPKSVLIGAPHTSNWDLFIALLTFWTLSIPARWVGKHTIFRWPIGGLLRRLGGIPLDRTTTRDFVRQVVEHAQVEEAAEPLDGMEDPENAVDHIEVIPIGQALDFRFVVLQRVQRFDHEGLNHFTHLWIEMRGFLGGHKHAGDSAVAKQERPGLSCQK